MKSGVLQLAVFHSFSMSTELMFDFAVVLLKVRKRHFAARFAHGLESFGA